MIRLYSIHCHKATRVRPVSGSERGAALLAVLWVIALLIGLVAGASLLLTQDLDAAAAKRQVFRARMLAESALAIAMNDVQPDDPLLRRQISEDEEYEVHMTGEDGLINPNILLQREDRETFRRIFRYWGMTLPQADELIDLLIDWVDADDFRRIKGAEKKEYGRTGKPFNRPFRSIEEMSMVRGMEVVEQAYPEWRTWFSVYASGVLDVTEARPEIVSAVLGVDMRVAQNLRRACLGRDGILNSQDDQPPLMKADALAILGIPNENSSIVGDESATKRLVIRVRVGDLTRELSAVIRGAIGQGPGQGATAILHMSETNPIVETP